MTLGFDEFAWVGQSLGLKLEPAEDSLFAGNLTLDGTVDGILVHALHWRGQYVHVEITAYLDPAADFTFSLSPAGAAAKLANLLGGHDVEVGEKAFDDAFEISSEEPERVRALLTPALREVLMGWRGLSHFEVRADRVYFWTIPGSYSTMEATILRDAIRSIAGLAKAVSLTLPQVPASTRLAGEVEAWRALATERGFALTPSPLRLVGKLGLATFAARVMAHPKAPHGVEISARFDERLPFYLRVQPARFRDYFSSDAEGTRTETGDAAFDDALRLVTSDPVRAKAFLDDEVRAALLALHATEGELVLRADGLSITTKRLIAPATFEGIVERVAAVARKLEQKAGPYR